MDSATGDAVPAGSGSGSDQGESIDIRFGQWAGALAARHGHPGDGRGSLGLVDEAARQRASDAVVSGEVAALARVVSAGASLRRDGQESFAMRTFVQQGADGAAAIGTDHVDIDCHGFVNTHIDALNHMGFEGTWFGGRPIGGEVPEAPSVLDLATGGIFARAVRVDIPALRGEPWVQPGQPVTGGEIEGALAAAGETFLPGDALLLDMGRDRLEATGASLSDPGPRPGAGWSAAEWIADHKVSVLCWDMLDASGAGEPRGPVHRLTWALGLILVDNCDFTACRQLLARVGRQRAALAVGPLAFAGATGCLVNPLAIV